MTKAVSVATEAEVERVIRSREMPVLLEFWAEWCGPCRRLAPILDELAREYEGRATVVKVEIDRHPEIATRMHVSMAPTLLFLRRGEVEERLVGLRSKAELATRIDHLLAD